MYTDHPFQFLKCAHNSELLVQQIINEFIQCTVHHKTTLMLHEIGLLFELNR